MSNATQKNPSVIVCIADEEARDEVTLSLMADGYPVSQVWDPKAVAATAAIQEPDCVIFEGDDGAVEAIREVKKLGADRTPYRSTAIVAVVPMSAEGRAQRVKELAEEYVIKPCRAGEVADRVSSAVSQVETAPESVIEVDSHLAINLDARTATFNGEPLVLSRMEFQLLVRLAKDPYAVVEKEQLYRDVWGYSGANSRSLEAHASRLRRKLDRERNGSYIVNRWAIGFSLLPPEKAPTFGKVVASR